MDKEELQEARTNPEFLDYLEKTRINAIAARDISALYEVLDSMLILDLDEEKINSVYQTILETSFEKVEIIVNNNQKLTLDDDHMYYIRALYEHGIEKWSYDNFDGAKDLLFVLSNIVEDEILVDSLQVHIIALANKTKLDDFYENEVDLNSCNSEEKYGYFITSFNKEVKSYLEENKTLLKEEYENLKHLLEN
ncbi:hypothetical protein [Halarcobacter bivalviorum]|uniref:DUF4375 domain-containing protein n=1 Tax=Halarcobacter bivalviorum TaxID=663364 RepID=A0AAX2A9S2_9BACT|nr:hypothetical protein [Halarcobacter bivalviorum]AXH13316.1 hypothetical protein ABIV_2342 [Halarcobacter bivalviorum]RXK04746.1 hypothetical protein CRU97_10040 [Halarcobacter bivalviorum]RXK10078.1 hypothetical protein CRV05_06790 [Halarcobacter bivalviorum]